MARGRVGLGRAVDWVSETRCGRVTLLDDMPLGRLPSPNCRREFLSSGMTMWRNGADWAAAAGWDEGITPSAPLVDFRGAGVSI